MNVPVWLLDIDGVINAATRGNPPTHAWPAADWIDTRAADGNGKSWRILAAEPVVEFIRTVHDSGTAEIRWHTTWQHDAQLVADVLNLPKFPVHDAPEFLDLEGRPGWDWWKLPGARRVVEDEGRRLVWTDDDAVTLTPPQREQLKNVGALVLAPNVQTGLCSSHLRKIEAFLNGGGQP